MISIKSEDLRDCKTVFQLSELLEIQVKTLLFFAYKNEDLYTEYSIKKKSGGVRIISAPTQALKTVSKKLASRLNEIYNEFLPNSSHGFVNERGIVTNASKHLSKKYILNLDLEDFFQTINSGRVMGLFRDYPFLFNKKIASILTGITTHKNILPQGSPCSPVLSNMICFRLDSELTKLAEKMGWTYTRYADDITFSTNELSDSLAFMSNEGMQPGERIKLIIKRNGFEINSKKTRLARPNQSKWVTGIKINKELNVSRKLIRQIRANIYFLENQKLQLDQEEFLFVNKNIINVVRGKLSHVGNVKLKTNLTYIKLHNRLCQLENKLHKRIPESIKEQAMEKTLVIQTSQGFASGFFISKNIIVTAAHILCKGERTVKFSVRSKKSFTEFRTASVFDVIEDKDLAILHTMAPNFSVFSPDFSSRNLNHDNEYISLGYGGYRTDGDLSSDVCAVDQKIVQTEDGDALQYRVVNPMWSGMSGGPIILKDTGAVVGYITMGASTQEASTEIKGFFFRPISNIPEKYRNNCEPITRNTSKSDDFLF